MNKATFDPTLNNNALLMEEFIDGIAASAKAGSLDHIAVYGYASPEGPFRINDRLSRQRCKAVAAYISRRAGIPLNSIQTYPGGVAWDGLRDLVAAEDLTPSRDEVLRILDEYLPGACTDRALSDRCRQSLTAIDNGRSFKWMLANLYPKLRYSLGIYTYYVSDSVATRQVIEGAEVRPVIAGVATIPESLLAENEVIFTPPYFI
ncbi:MAG: hypothetical protein K2M97_05920 [Muribaculaceae bacterium]|nr:hypothetical protein [Muribaculaceae bacterium]